MNAKLTDKNISPFKTSLVTLTNALAAQCSLIAPSQATAPNHTNQPHMLPIKEGDCQSNGMLVDSDRKHDITTHITTRTTRTITTRSKQ
jgi:hypothetical protein